jgi:hypothetical protein
MNDIIAAIAADREAQAADPAVRRRAEDVLRQWVHAALPESERGFVNGRVLRQAVAEMLDATTWTRPAQAGCDCLAAGGQGLRPSGLPHADDCPAVSDAPDIEPRTDNAAPLSASDNSVADAILRARHSA